MKLHKFGTLPDKGCPVLCAAASHSFLGEVVSLGSPAKFVRYSSSVGIETFENLGLLTEVND